MHGEALVAHFLNLRIAVVDGDGNQVAVFRRRHAGDVEAHAQAVVADCLGAFDADFKPLLFRHVESVGSAGDALPVTAEVLQEQIGDPLLVDQVRAIAA